jgi:hypothetical protein
MFTQSPEQRRIIAGTDVLRFPVYGKSNYGRISIDLSNFGIFSRLGADRTFNQVKILSLGQSTATQILHR